ncbi:MAG: hypothetical protein HRT57_00335 [Crocinitomicaceae bacterium]|nr:hypothetical protein [Crocinitomicaceae bacterium]
MNTVNVTGSKLLFKIITQPEDVVHHGIQLVICLSTLTIWQQECITHFEAASTYGNSIISSVVFSLGGTTYTSTVPTHTFNMPTTGAFVERFMQLLTSQMDHTILFQNHIKNV